MSEKQGIIKAVVVLVVICFVISGALAVVNSFTAPVSKANAEARETAARQELIPEASDFEQVTKRDLHHALCPCLHPHRGGHGARSGLSPAFLCSELCRRLRHLALSCADDRRPSRDEEWRVRAAEIQAKRQEENRVLREIDLARRHYAETHTDEFTPPSLGESSTTW